MSTTISQALSNSIQEKQPSSNIIINISSDMNKGYSALKKTIAGGGNKAKHIPGTKSHEILSKNQITSQGEKRGQQWIDQRNVLD